MSISSIRPCACMSWVQNYWDTLNISVTPFFDSPKVGRNAGDPEVCSTEHILKFFTKYLRARGGEEPTYLLPTREHFT